MSLSSVRSETALGRVPHLVAADSAFYSTKNEDTAKVMGVKRVCIPSRSTKSPDHTEPDLTLHPGIASVSAAVEPVPPLDHADAAVARGPPFLPIAELTLSKLNLQANS